MKGHYAGHGIGAEDGSFRTGGAETCSRGRQKRTGETSAETWTAGGRSWGEAAAAPSAEAQRPCRACLASKLRRIWRSKSI